MLFHENTVNKQSCSADLWSLVDAQVIKIIFLRCLFATICLLPALVEGSVQIKSLNLWHLISGKDKTFTSPSMDINPSYEGVNA